MTKSHPLGYDLALAWFARGEIKPYGVGLEADPDPATKDIDRRWLVGHQRSEIARLEARHKELQRQLRRRTWWLVAAAVVGGLISLVVISQVLHGSPLPAMAGITR